MKSATTARSAELGSAARHLFLSPHYDDIPLSAGAAVKMLANQGATPRTLVVFGSEPDPAASLTRFAQELHAAWGLSAGQVIAHRQAEERAAAAVLGAETAVLPFRDAIYRGQAYLSDHDLFGAPAEADRDLPARIVASLDLGDRPAADTRLYAPLGVGRHVDHQLVFRAGTALAARGWDVWFYEDIPYALKPGAFAARLFEIGATTLVAPAAAVSAESVWDDKIAAILSYPSQLETVFRQYVGVGTDRSEISAALRAYAKQDESSAPVERFWKIEDASNNTGC